MTCSEGPQGGIEPMTAAVSIQPLLMGRLLYQLSHQMPPDKVIVLTDKNILQSDLDIRGACRLILSLFSMKPGQLFSLVSSLKLD